MEAELAAVKLALRDPLSPDVPGDLKGVPREDLREEQKQLREEKKQLLKKEEQLREEKILLLKRQDASGALPSLAPLHQLHPPASLARWTRAALCASPSGDRSTGHAQLLCRHARRESRKCGIRSGLTGRANLTDEHDASKLGF